MSSSLSFCPSISSSLFCTKKEGKEEKEDSEELYDTFSIPPHLLLLTSQRAFGNGRNKESE